MMEGRVVKIHRTARRYCRGNSTIAWFTHKMAVKHPSKHRHGRTPDAYWESQQKLWRCFWDWLQRWTHWKTDRRHIQYLSLTIGCAYFLGAATIILRCFLFQRSQSSRFNQGSCFNWLSCQPTPTRREKHRPTSITPMRHAYIHIPNP